MGLRKNMAMIQVFFLLFMTVTESRTRRVRFISVKPLTAVFGNIPLPRRQLAPLIFPFQEAVIFGSIRIFCRSISCVKSIKRKNVPSFFTFIRGKSIPISPNFLLVQKPFNSVIESDLAAIWQSYANFYAISLFAHCPRELITK